MLWRGQRQSENVEDRRGVSRGGIAIGGGLGGIVLLVIALLMGADPRQLLEQLPTQDPASRTRTSRSITPQEEERKQFVLTVLANTEDVWTDLFRQMGRQYRKPTLVLFTDQVESACGIAGAAVGPFYCPGDEKVYLDLSFLTADSGETGPGRLAIRVVTGSDHRPARRVHEAHLAGLLLEHAEIVGMHVARHRQVML